MMRVLDGFAWVIDSVDTGIRLTTPPKCEHGGYEVHAEGPTVGTLLGKPGHIYRSTAHHNPEVENTLK